MTAIDYAIALLIVTPVLPGLASLLLASEWLSPSPSLHERALLAFRDWLVASIAAVLALGRLGYISLPAGWTLPMLVVALLLVSLPSGYWLWLYFRGAFRR